MHDFLAIGDTVVDDFIKLKEANVTCDIDHEKCTISMPFGEKIPFESVESVYAVGNSANAAVAASRLGLSSALVTNLGNDYLGRKCLESLERDKVDTQYVKVNEGMGTNHHYVLWYEADRTILVKHEKYAYKLPDIRSPKWLYLSSLGDDTFEYHREILSFLKAHPNVNLAFQPGTFQIRHSKELGDIYKRSKIFFCNLQEAEIILGVDTLGIQEVLKRMRDLGSEIAVITDGPKGAYSYDGSQMLFHSPYPDEKPPYDRTGAGDAFASTTVAALSLGKSLEEAINWGMVNSMSVVQHVGAQKGLLSKEKIEEYLNKFQPLTKAVN